MKFKILFCLMFLTPVTFASVPSNINSFVANLNKDASTQRQKNIITTQNFNASIKALDNKSSAPVDNVSMALQTSKTNDKIPSANCNGENDEYNYPSNFIYNENKQKVYRLHPFAKCITSASTKQQPITALQTNNTTGKKDTSSQWNINY